MPRGRRFRADDSTYQSRLRRKYLSKLSPELRSTVLSKVWMLDGEERPARKPNSWEEAARAVEIEMESRADARAPTDSINACGDGEPALGRATARCNFCQRTGHQTEICPKAAAQRRGEVDQCLADHERTARACTICGAPDHKDRHHRLGASDANYSLGQDGGTLSWNGGANHINLNTKKHSHPT